MLSFIFFGVLLLCVVCFACISTNMVFYVISYDTPPVNSAKLQRIFFCRWFLDVDKLSHDSTEKMMTYPMYLCRGFRQNVLSEYEWIHSGYIYN